MENQQQGQQGKKPKDKDKSHDNTIGGAQTNRPDPEAQNDTGYAGTTNSPSEHRNDQDGYQIAIEDTMIGYDGDDSQMDMDMGEEDRRRSGKTGIDDNS
jgi:hypothetical protein